MSVTKSNERYLKTIQAVGLITSGMNNCRFHDFPEDIVRLIFETAAESTERPDDFLLGRKSKSPWSLAPVSRKIKEWAEPLLYRRIYVIPGSRTDLLGRTIFHHPSKPHNFFALHVKQLVFDSSTAPTAIVFEIVKACSSIRSLTDYSAGVVCFCRMKKHPCSWTRNITHLEVKVGVGQTPPLVWIQDTIADIHCLTHLRMGFTETTQPPYNEIGPFVGNLVKFMPTSLQVLGVTLFLHSYISQDDLVEVVRNIIKMDIRVVVALWPTGSVSDAVRQLSVVRTRSFQWHTNDEFWDEATEEVEGRRRGSRKWPADPVQRSDAALVDRWRSLSMYDWRDLAGVA